MDISNRITQIHQEDLEVTFMFEGTAQEAAALRNKICRSIKHYAVHRILFHKNVSQATYEKLSHRLGLLIVNNQQVNKLKGELNIKGPKMVTCDDITDIPFACNTPILYLDEWEWIHCEIMIEEGCGATHQKWNPVSGIAFKQERDKFKFNFELTGAVDFNTILNQL